MGLPKSEEQVMKYLWNLKQAFMKDLIDAYPAPKPAPSTIATLLKRLQNKKAVGFKKYGSVRAYYPLITKEAYFSGQLKNVIKNFFGNSNMQFASFFTEETGLSDEELEQLKEMVDKQLKDRKNDDLSD